MAVNLINIEGGLDAQTAAQVQEGQRRLIGHALADSLVVHLGRRNAASHRMMRSIRLATHPAARRRGLATKLVGAAERWAHREQGASLAGTLFGATPAVLRFRQAAGYRLVRVGGSAGARTGAPSAVMIRPLDATAEPLLEDLRQELCWALPAQLDLLRSEVLVGPDHSLLAALADLAPAGSPPSLARCKAALTGALHGPRTLDSVQWAVERLLETRSETTVLAPEEAALLRCRVHERASWEATRRAAGLPSVRSTQRGLKQVLRKLLLP